MSTEELLKPRYKVIADYPDSRHCVGDIISYYNDGSEYAYTPDKWEGLFTPYPAIFKKIEWWQERGVDILKTVKFVKVIKYRGYWLVGDIVKAKLKIDEEFTPLGYFLEGHHYQPVFELEPATESEYLNQKK